MTIGTALIIIAILYLIDKHNLWKRAAAACLVALAVALVGFAGYRGWQKWQERKVPEHVVFDEPIDLSAGLVPNWDALPPPKGYTIDNDVSYVILYPVKARETEKTDAWVWYRDSKCATVGGRQQPANHVLHERDLFSFDSYDTKWMSNIALPQEVKRALWNAKVAECRLHPGTKGVKACLDRATGAVDVGPWVEYKTSCGSKMEMIYLQSETEQKN